MKKPSQAGEAMARGHEVRSQSERRAVGARGAPTEEREGSV